MKATAVTYYLYIGWNNVKYDTSYDYVGVKFKDDYKMFVNEFNNKYNSFMLIIKHD